MEGSTSHEQGVLAEHGLAMAAQYMLYKSKFVDVKFSDLQGI